MKKRAYVTLSHHHVIKEWFRHKGTGAHLLSFDYHTDFHEAFIGKTWNPVTVSCGSRDVYLSKHIPCRDVDAAIKDLQNDEHIDFALKTGMIEKAFVFSHNSYSSHDGRVLSVPNGRKHFVQARIFSYCEAYHPLVTQYCYDDPAKPEMAKLITTDEVLNEVMKTFQEYGFNQDNYILDFDCDFISDKAAMEHDKLQTLKSLIKGARAITIALEPRCVEECSEYSLSSCEIRAWLAKLINDSCGDDVEIIDAW